VSYKCNYLSLTAWFILIQYFLLIKLFLPTLLTAMFSTTGQRVSEISEQLWMYQRYEIVMEYEKRLIFAPPFTVIYYAFFMVYKFFQLLGYFVKQCFVRLRRLCCCGRWKSSSAAYELDNTAAANNNNTTIGNANDTLHSKQTGTMNTEVSSSHGAEIKKLDDSHSSVNLNNTNSSNDNIKMFNYWSSVAQKYSEECEKEDKQKSNQKQIETNMNKVREDLGTQKKTLQRLNDRVISLEKALNQNHSYLEQIKNLLTQRVSKSGLLDRKKRNFIHILSRESPYIFTNIPRFFVYEKLVHWECYFDLYDVKLFLKRGIPDFTIIWHDMMLMNNQAVLFIT
jgi:hypothetical protein